MLRTRVQAEHRGTGTMRSKSVYGSLVLAALVVSTAWAQLPLIGEAGPYQVVSDPAFGAPGLIAFRPADLDGFPQRDTLPVMAWGNGSCAKNSDHYAAFLKTIASHGFLVLATAIVKGERLPPPAIILGADGVARVQVSPADLKAALDWAEAEDVREDSPLRGKIATDRMAVMGQSCGGLVAIALGADPRVDTIGVFNAGAPVGWPDARQTTLPTITALANLHGPALFVNGHAADPAMAESAANFDAIESVPAFYGARRKAGHLGTIGQPGGGEFANVASQWLQWTLKGDRRAAAMFVGKGCGLCTDPNWETRSKRLQ